MHKDRTLVSRHNEKSVCSVGLVYERDELARNRCVHPGHSGSMPWLQSLRIWCCMGKLERCRPACVHKPFVTAETILVSRTQPITVVSAIGNDCTDDLCEKYQYHPPEVSFSASKGPLVPRKRAVSLELSNNPLMSGAPDDDSLPIFTDLYMRRFCTPVNPQQYEPHRVSFRSSKGPLVPRKRAVSLEIFNDARFTQSLPTWSTANIGSVPASSQNYMRRVSTSVDPEKQDPRRANVRFTKSRVIPSKRAVWLEDIGIV